ncbi:hypothetical protein INR77_04640 [Erythrobacter sp. SCSIO 43205]|nr:hypothetical protein [Erythrobacter sp. SCSIO 43205]UAB78988.1 hypothetical protein INR77_04640 [Erythrobacter sp. SCSIO 43205]
MIKRARSWLASRLGLRKEEAKDGSWWEIDFILVLLAGSVVWGLYGLLA